MFRLLSRCIQGFNLVTGYLSAAGIVVCTGALSYEVVVRYFFNDPTDWSLEFNIFMLVGATFMGSAYTQMKRAHVGIGLLDGLLPDHWNRLRLFLSDVLSMALCGFVAWYSWAYFYQAWDEGWVTDSPWGPKLWIPYFFMALGMTTLTIQYVIQIVEGLLLSSVKGES